jgi:hypothetical protein
MLRQVRQKLALGMGVGEHGDEEFRYQEAIERSTVHGDKSSLVGRSWLEKSSRSLPFGTPTLSFNKF